MFRDIASSLELKELALTFTMKTYATYKIFVFTLNHFLDYYIANSPMGKIRTE